MIGAGILLMLKKEIDWIQPPTQRGVSSDVPALSLEDLFAAAQGAGQAGLESWQDLARVDFKPEKGVVKFVGKNDWEVQVDTATGSVLHVAERRSDFIESLHDGSYFSDSVKYFLFLPAGIVLLVLWATGLYLFFLPHYKNYQKRKAKRLKSKNKSDGGTSSVDAGSNHQPAE